MYFHDFQSQDVDYNSYRYTFLSYSLAPYVKTNTFRLISDRNFNLNHGTVNFLEPKISGEDMYDFPKGFDGFIYNDKRILVFTPDRQPDVLWVKSNYPWVKEKNIYGRKREKLFTLISVNNL